MKYRVTRKFIDGLFKGMTFTGNTNVEFVLGKTYTEVLTGYHYQIISIYIYAEEAEK